MSQDKGDLPSIIDIQEGARLLPGRPQFWTSYTMADFYQTTPKRVVEQLRRNPRRFPADFWFDLRKDETDALVPHFAAPNRLNRGVLVGFTRAGVLALATVLRTPVADAVSVQIIRAFIAMEAAQLADVTFLLQKVQSDARNRRPVRARIVDAARDGWDFDKLKSTVSLSRPKLAKEVHDCVTLGLIAELLPGTPARPGVRWGNPDQGNLFGEG